VGFYPFVPSSSGGGSVDSVTAADTSIVIGGTSSNPTVAAGFEATASEFQPLGPAATGSRAYAARSNHVHPYQPYQFLPESYGAIGDGKIVSDGAMSSSVSPTHLTCATTTPFTSADAGKTICVIGAGSAGANLYTTISSYTSASVVVLAASCATTVSGTGVAWGTDNGTAILGAHNAAWSYAQSAPGNKAQVVFGSGVYVVGAALSWAVGATYEGNALFPFPLVAGTGNAKATVDYVGLGGDVCALPHWEQAEPQLTGSTVLVLRADGTDDGTYGPSSVFGGPYNGYGGEPGTYTNLSVTVDQVCVAGPFNPTFGGWDFFGVAEAFVPNGSFMPLGIVPSGAWPQLNNASISNQYTWGLRMPSAGNNDRCDTGYWSAYGLCYGFGPSEHATWVSVRCNYCIIGIEGYAGNAVTMAHAIRGGYASVEACAQALGFFDGVVKMDISTLDSESVANVVYDPSSHGQGTICFRGDEGTGYASSGVVNGGAGLRLYNLNQAAGPVSSPQAPPATTVAWLNGYYRDAWMTVALSGGHTFTSLDIDSAAQPAAAGAGAYAFMLPAGHSYTPAYSAGTLTHTVTLL
jgi:hypothetical protein